MKSINGWLSCWPEIPSALVRQRLMFTNGCYKIPSKGPWVMPIHGNSLL